MNNQKKLGELLNKLHLRISSETKPPSITHLITLTKLLTHILNPNQLTIPGLNLIQLIETLPDKWLAPHVHPNIHPGDGDAKGDGGGVEVILSSTVIEQIVVHLFRLLPEPGYRKVHKEVVSLIGSLVYCLCVHKPKSARLFIHDCVDLLSDLTKIRALVLFPNDSRTNSGKENRSPLALKGVRVLALQSFQFAARPEGGRLGEFGFGGGDEVGDAPGVGTGGIVRGGTGRTNLGVDSVDSANKNRRSTLSESLSQGKAKRGYLSAKQSNKRRRLLTTRERSSSNLGSNYNLPSLILDVSQPIRLDLVQTLTTTVIKQLFEHPLTCHVCVDIHDAMTSILLYQLVRASDSLQMVSFQALVGMIQRNFIPRAFTTPTITALLHFLTDNTTRLPFPSYPTYHQEDPSIWRALRLHIPVESFRPFLGKIMDAIIITLTRIITNFETRLSHSTQYHHHIQEVARFLSHLVRNFPQIVANFTSLQPFLTHPFIRLQIIDCLRVAMRLTLESDPTLQSNYPTPTKDSKSRHRRQLLSPYKFVPQKVVKRCSRTKAASSSKHPRLSVASTSTSVSGTSSDSMDTFDITKALNGAHSQTLDLAYAKFWTFLDEIRRRALDQRLESFGKGNDPREVRNQILVFDTAFRLFVPNASEQAMVHWNRGLESWIRKVNSLSCSEHSGRWGRGSGSASIGLLVETVVDLVKEACDLIPNHHLASHMGPIVNLISIPWHESTSNPTSDTTTTLTSTKRKFEGKKENSLKVKHACLQLLGLIKVSIHDREHELIRLALKDDPEIQAVVYQLIPYHIVRIPNSKDHRSKQALKWVNELFKAAAANIESKGSNSGDVKAPQYHSSESTNIRCMMAKSLGYLFCIYANRDVSRERLVCSTRETVAATSFQQKSLDTYRIFCHSCDARNPRHQNLANYPKPNSTHHFHATASSQAGEAKMDFAVFRELVEWYTSETSLLVQEALVNTIFRAIRHVDYCNLSASSSYKADLKMVLDFVVSVLLHPEKTIRIIASKRIESLIDADGLGGPIVAILGRGPLGKAKSSKSSKTGTKVVPDNNDLDRLVAACVDSLIFEIDQKCQASSSPSQQNASQGAAAVSGKAGSGQAGQSRAQSQSDTGTAASSESQSMLYESELMETMLIALGSLGCALNVKSLAEFSLLKILITNMKNSTFRIRATAFAQICRIAKTSNLSTRDLVSLHAQKLYLHLIESLPGNPTIVDEVCEALLGTRDIRGFLLKDALPKVIPLLVIRNSRAALNCCTQLCDMEMETLVTEYLHQILSHVLTVDESERKQALCLVSDLTGRSTSLRHLISCCIPDLVNELVWKFSDPTQVESTDKALVRVMDMYLPSTSTANGGVRGKATGKSTRNSMDKSMAKAIANTVGTGDVKSKMGDFLADHFLHTFDFVIQTIDQVVRRSSGSGLGKDLVGFRKDDAEKALRCLRHLIVRVGKRLNRFIHKVMAALKIFLQVEEIRVTICEIWYDFLMELEASDVGPCLGQIVITLLPFLEHAKSRPSILRILRMLIIDRKIDLGDYFKDIPLISDKDSELSKIMTIANSHHQGNDFQNTLRQNLRLLTNESANVRLKAVSLITATIQQNRAAYVALVGETEGEGIGTGGSGILSKLLQSLLSHCNDPAQKVRLACCECLGELGALDPASQSISLTTQKTRFDKDDKLARFLITNKLIKSLRAAQHNRIVNKILYAIQELLKFCGCTGDSARDHQRWKDGEISKHTIDQDRWQAIQSWDRFPENIRTLIEPCLNSSYEPQVALPTVPDNDGNPKPPRLNKASNGQSGVSEKKGGSRTEGAAVDAGSDTVGGHTDGGDATGRGGLGSANKRAPPIAQLFSQAVHLPPSSKKRTSVIMTTKSPRVECKIFFTPSKKLKTWLGEWCRHLTRKSKGERSKIFQACYQVIKVDVDIAKFLLPYLVENVLVHGSSDELDRVVDEILAVLDDKALNVNCTQVVFDLMDLLEEWRNLGDSDSKANLPKGTGRSRASRSKSKALSSRGGSRQKMYKWKVSRKRFLTAIPTYKLAMAANRSKAMTRALRYFEMHLRSSINSLNDQKYIQYENGAVITKFRKEDLKKYQQIYAGLDDPDGMEGICSIKESTFIREQILHLESNGQWAEALTSYEQALRISSKFECHLGIVKSQLKLGNHAQALTHVQGAMHATGMQNYGASEKMGALTGYGISAAWRLGEWTKIDQFLRSMSASGGYDSSMIGHELEFEITLGKILLAIHKGQDAIRLQSLLSVARKDILRGLSAACQESYQRAYPYVCRLHALRDLEAMHSLVKINNQKMWDEYKAHWIHRLESTEPSFDIREVLLSLRTTMCSMMCSINQLLPCEEIDQCHLLVAKEARLAHQFEYATGAVLQARRYGTSMDIERAKLLKSKGHLHKALKYLEDLQRHTETSQNSFEDINPLSLPDESFPERKRKAELMLYIGQWTQECGAKKAQVVTECFRKSLSYLPGWETAHFMLGKFYDTLRQASIAGGTQGGTGADSKTGSSIATSRGGLASGDKKYLNLILEHYATSLLNGHKHIFHSLPRMLTVWFEFMQDVHDLELALRAPSAAGTSNSRSNTTRSSNRSRRKASLKCLPESLQKMVDKTSGHMKELVSVSYDDDRRKKNHKTGAHTKYHDCAEGSHAHIKAYQWYTALAQIISRFDHPHPNVGYFVRRVLSCVVAHYPSQALWSVAAVYFSTNTQRRGKAKKIMEYIRNECTNHSTNSTIKANLHIFEFFIAICKFRAPKSYKGKSVHLAQVFDKDSFLRILKRVPKGILVPIQSNLTAILPPNGLPEEDFNVFPAGSVEIAEIMKKVDVMPSKERPLKLKIRGNDGKMYLFLCKREDRGDMRKNSRLMEFCTVVNRLLRSSGEARKRKLRLRTFAVLPMTEECGLIEWVNNTTCYRHEVHETHEEVGIRFSYQEVMRLQKEHARNLPHWHREMTAKFPPIFHRWFTANFSEPTTWFENRQAYTRSVAAWSIVGYIVGLGDRHGENILLDKVNGECVHVDFDCLFDRGKTLEVPERVPFRLTQNIIDGFGVTGCSGTFEKSCQSILAVLRKNRETLMNVLYSFVHDPLVEWNYRSDDQDEKEDNRGVKANKIMGTIDSRLRGQPEGEGKMELALSVVGQVHQLIQDASCEENLSRMYIGWMPWL